MENDFNGLIKFIQEEIKKTHELNILKEEKLKIENDLKILEENKKKWMQDAFKKKQGSLHKALGVPEGETITVEKMKEALKNPKLKAKAQAAINANPDKYSSLKEEE